MTSLSGTKRRASDNDEESSSLLHTTTHPTPACFFAPLNAFLPIRRVLGQRRNHAKQQQLEVLVRWKGKPPHRSLQKENWVQWRHLNDLAQNAVIQFARDHGQEIIMTKEDDTRMAAAAAASVERETAAAAAADNDGGVFYEIEAVLDYKVERNRRLYLIRWKGYNKEHDSWEPESHLSPEALEHLPEAWKKKKKIPTTNRPKRTKQQPTKRKQLPPTTTSDDKMSTNDVVVTNGAVDMINSERDSDEAGSERVTLLSEDKEPPLVGHHKHNDDDNEEQKDDATPRDENAMSAGAPSVVSEAKSSVETSIEQQETVEQASVLANPESELDEAVVDRIEPPSDHPEPAASIEILNGSGNVDSPTEENENVAPVNPSMAPKDSSHLDATTTRNVVESPAPKEPVTPSNSLEMDEAGPPAFEPPSPEEIHQMVDELLQDVGQQQQQQQQRQVVDEVQGSAVEGQQVAAVALDQTVENDITALINKETSSKKNSWAARILEANSEADDTTNFAEQPPLEVGTLHHDEATIVKGSRLVLQLGDYLATVRVEHLERRK